jgi:predicted DCC family thiol-disulfide oxidoreductase YuxK
MPKWPDDDVILFDGTCIFCSRWVRFVATVQPRRAQSLSDLWEVRRVLRAGCGLAGAGDRVNRHCERSEAIQTVSAERYWIASLRSQ